LWGCNQNSPQQTADNDVHRGPPPNSQKVEKSAEHASRELAAGATAVVEGVRKGVKEGVHEGQRDAHDARSDQNPNDRARDQRASNP
jgi:hypothetical protein